MSKTPPPPKRPPLTSNEKQKRLRARRKKLNRTRREFYLTDAETVEIKRRIQELREP